MVSRNAIQFLKRASRQAGSVEGPISIEPFSLDERDAFLELEGYGLISGSTYKGGAFVRVTASGREFLSTERPHKKAITYLISKFLFTVDELFSNILSIGIGILVGWLAKAYLG